MKNKNEELTSQLKLVEKSLGESSEKLAACKNENCKLLKKVDGSNQESKSNKNEVYNSIIVLESSLGKLKYFLNRF